jgi:hypothetical protein
MLLSSRHGHDSTTRRARLRHLSLEQLETRTPLAGDLAAELPPEGYQAAVKLEIVDLAGNVVTSVKVGEDFRLQARLIVPGGTDPFSGYGDFTFLPELVAPVSSAGDLGLNNAQILDGEIDEAGRIMYWTPTPDVILSKTFRAMAAGTATFDSNAIENVYLETLFTGLAAPLDVSTINFGSVDLEIIAGDDPNEVPELPQEGLQKLSRELELLADEYAQHLLGGSTGQFVSTNSSYIIENGHVMIVAFNRPMEEGPGPDEEFAIFASELSNRAGVVNMVNAWGFIHAWVPLERIRDLNAVPSLVQTVHMPREIIDQSPPTPPSVRPDEPVLPLPFDPIRFPHIPWKSWGGIPTTPVLPVTTPPVTTPPVNQPPVEVVPVEPPVVEYAATVVLEILNGDGQVVDRVNANEVFTVRARMLVTSGADPVAAYLDLQFAADMVSPLNNPVDLGRINAKRTVDEIKGIGRVMYYSDQPDVIFTKTFQARQPGEVTFTTNPGDHWWDEILYVGLKAPLPTSLVKFGSVTLQIDAAVPPPIHNPQSPGSQIPFDEPIVITEPVLPIDGLGGPYFIPSNPADAERGHIGYVPADSLVRLYESQVSLADLPLSFSVVDAPATSRFGLLPVLTPAAPLRSSPPLVGSALRSASVQLVSSDSLGDWQLIANREASKAAADDVASSEPTDDSASESTLLLEIMATTDTSVMRQRKKK